MSGSIHITPAANTGTSLKLNINTYSTHEHASAIQLEREYVVSIAARGSISPIRQNILLSDVFLVIANENAYGRNAMRYSA